MRRYQVRWMSLVVSMVLSGCSANTVKLLFIPEENKVVLNPEPGTVLKWAGPKGAQVPVSFPFGNPCKKGTEPVGQCTIDVPSARVPYDCKDCADPEIVVGTEISNGLKGGLAAGEMAVTPANVYMKCSGSAAAIYPAEIKISKAAAAGARVLWIDTGLPTIGEWKADGFSGSICLNSPPFNKTNNTCNLAPNPMPGTTTYTVSSALCNGSSAPGKITITP